MYCPKSGRKEAPKETTENCRVQRDSFESEFEVERKMISLILKSEVYKGRVKGESVDLGLTFWRRKCEFESRIKEQKSSS